MHNCGPPGRDILLFGRPSIVFLGAIFGFLATIFTSFRMSFSVSAACRATFGRYFGHFWRPSFFMFRTIFAELKTVISVAATIISLLMTLAAAAKVLATRAENGLKTRGTGRHMAKRYAEHR